MVGAVEGPAGDSGGAFVFGVAVPVVEVSYVVGGGGEDFGAEFAGGDDGKVFDVDEAGEEGVCEVDGGGFEYVSCVCHAHSLA